MLSDLRISGYAVGIESIERHAVTIGADGAPGQASVDLRLQPVELAGRWLRRWTDEYHEIDAGKREQRSTYDHEDHAVPQADDE